MTAEEEVDEQLLNLERLVRLHSAQFQARPRLIMFFSNPTRTHSELEKFRLPEGAFKPKTELPGIQRISWG